MQSQETRIHPTCNKDEAHHDKSVKENGYCRTCGERKPIHMLRSIYKEYEPAKTVNDKINDKLYNMDYMKSMANGIKQRSEMKPLPASEMLIKLRKDFVGRYNIKSDDQLILIQIIEQVKNLESKQINR